MKIVINLLFIFIFKVHCLLNLGGLLGGLLGGGNKKITVQENKIVAPISNNKVQQNNKIVAPVLNNKVQKQ